MLFFGHTGLTTALALLIETRTNRVRTSTENTLGATRLAPSHKISGQLGPVNSKALRLDYRLVLVGSLFPDIIDKPLGLILFRSSLGNGRTIGHTLALIFFLAVAGFIVRKRKLSFSILTVAFGSLVHLLFDQMWLEPTVILWPVFGLAFPQGNPDGWLMSVLRYGFTHPSVYVPEILGLATLASLFWHLVKKRGLRHFSQHGNLPLKELPAKREPQP